MIPPKTLHAMAIPILLLLSVAGAWRVGAQGPHPEPVSGQAAQSGPATGEDRQPGAADGREAERNEMVRVIRSYGLNDRAVLEAMGQVPRHAFVPAEYRKRAYQDTPLPIGYGQTISQPFIVAEMTRLLQLNQESRVLEVGTGSGYQAAVLRRFTPHVYSVEIIEPLAAAAAARLSQLGYEVRTRQGDGYFGWPEQSPFDAIVVTAAAGEIPPPLIDQLAAGGRMVIPVGPVFGTQSLMLVQKDPSGKVRTQSLMPVRFVPLTGQHSRKP